MCFLELVFGPPSVRLRDPGQEKYTRRLRRVSVVTVFFVPVRVSNQYKHHQLTAQAPNSQSRKYGTVEDTTIVNTILPAGNDVRGQSFAVLLLFIILRSLFDSMAIIPNSVNVRAITHLPPFAHQFR